MQCGSVSPVFGLIAKGMAPQWRHVAVAAGSYCARATPAAQKTLRRWCSRRMAPAEPGPRPAGLRRPLRTSARGGGAVGCDRRSAELFAPLSELVRAHFGPRLGDLQIDPLLRMQRSGPLHDYRLSAGADSPSRPMPPPVLLLRSPRGPRGRPASRRRSRAPRQAPGARPWPPGAPPRPPPSRSPPQSPRSRSKCGSSGSGCALCLSLCP